MAYPDDTGNRLGGELPTVSGITGTTRVAPGGPYSNFAPAVGYYGQAVQDNTGVGYAGSVATGSTMMSAVTPKRGLPSPWRSREAGGRTGMLG